MRRRIPFALVLTAAALATASLALGQEPAECPPEGLVPQLMTPPAEYLPADGALVVGLFPGGSDTRGELPPLALTRLAPFQRAGRSHQPLEYLGEMP